MGGKFLVIAISKFGDDLDDLDTSSTTALVEALERTNHVVECSENPDIGTFNDSLRRTCEGEYTVVHFLTHGARGAASHDLWVASAHARRQPTNSRQWVNLRSWLSEIADYTLASANLLVFLDVCYAGDAARLDFADEGSRKVYVFAGAEPGHLAFRARFTRSVARVFARLADADDFGAHPAMKFIPLALIRNALAAELEATCKLDHAIAPQRLVTSRHELEEHSHTAFPNPNFGRISVERGGITELAQREPALADTTDPVLGGGHFLMRAAGAGASQPTAGIHFVGREDELHRLFEWLDCEKPDGWVRVVTGSPAMGKSALLGVVVCLAHPELAPYTYRVEQRFVSRPFRRSAGQMAAVHARNRDLSELVRSLSRQLNPDAPVNRPDDLVAVLHSLPTPPVIVLDALDEATDPVGVHLRLLQRLISERRPNGRGLCRLLIGSRKEPRFASLFAESTSNSIINLDDFDAAKLRENVADYVTSLLREHARWHGPRIPAAFAEAVADSVTPGQDHSGAEIDVGPYLLAQLHTYRVASGPQPASPGAAARLGHRTPRSIEEAFAVEFEATTNDPAAAWLKPMLSAFAFAEGTGMPLSHARSIAQNLSATPLPACSDTCLREVITNRARFYLRTDVDDDGSALYALFHRSLQQHLRAMSGDQPEAALAALRDNLGYTTGRSDWQNRATPYIRRHYGRHAIAAGAFDDVVTDPNYLAFGEHVRVVRDLRHARSPSAQSAAAIYRASIAHHAVSSPQHRLERLALDAARVGDDELRTAIATTSGRPGVTKWTTCVSVDDRAPLLDHLDDDAAGNAVACMNSNGRSLAVTGGTDGVIRFWDLGAGVLRMRQQRAGRVEAIGCTEIGGRPAAITGFDNGELLVWDLSCPENPLMGSLHGCNTAVRSIFCGQLAGRSLAVTASDGEGVLVWDLENLDHRPIGDAGHHDGVRAASLGLLYGEPVVLSGGNKGRLRIWDLGHRGGLWKSETLGGHHSAILAMAGRNNDDDELVAVTGDQSGTVIAWTIDPPWHADPEGTGPHVRPWLEEHWLYGSKLYSGESSVRAVACGPTRGQPFIILHSDGTNKVWWLDGNRHSKRKRIDDGGAITAIACGILDGRSIAVTVSDRGTRIWGLTTPTSRKQELRSYRGGAVHSVAAGAGRAEPFLVSGSDDGALRLWSKKSADQPVCVGATAPNRGAVRKVVCTTRAGRPIAISVTSRRARLWELGDPNDNHPKSYLQEFPNLRGSMHAVACGHIGNRTVAVIGGSRGVVRVWDVSDPENLMWRDLPGHRGRVQATAFIDVHGQPVAVTGASDGSIFAWDLSRDDDAKRMTLQRHNAGVESLACINDGQNSFAVIGFADGSIQTWNLSISEDGQGRDGKEALAYELISHEGPVQTIACGFLDREPVTITGGRDNYVKLWRLRTGEQIGAHVLPSYISDLAIMPGELAVCYHPDLAVLDYPGLSPTSDAAAGE